MRKIVGIAIIALSLFLGLCSAVYDMEDIIFSILLFWIISLPIYISGQILRTSKADFKERGKRWISIYVYFFFILPLVFHYEDYYLRLKETIMNNGQFVVFKNSSGSFGEFSIFIFMLLIALLGGRFLNPELKRKKLLNISIISTVILLLGFDSLMFSDYRGIHKEKGLVTSTWQGDKHILPYNDIDSILVVPYVHRGKLSDTSDETRFGWKVIFKPSNHKDNIVYYFSVQKSSLEQTFEIKKIAKENDIHFNIVKMDKKTLKWFDLDLELEGLEKKRYYKLFQVNS